MHVGCVHVYVGVSLCGMPVRAWVKVYIIVVCLLVCIRGMPVGVCVSSWVCLLRVCLVTAVYVWVLWVRLLDAYAYGGVIVSMSVGVCVCVCHHGVYWCVYGHACWMYVYVGGCQSGYACWGWTALRLLGCMCISGWCSLDVCICVRHVIMVMPVGVCVCVCIIVGILLLGCVCHHGPACWGVCMCIIVCLLGWCVCGKPAGCVCTGCCVGYVCWVHSSLRDPPIGVYASSVCLGCVCSRHACWDVCMWGCQSGYAR